MLIVKRKALYKNQYLRKLVVKIQKLTGKTLVTNILKFSAVSIISAILSFTVIPLITRIFSPEEYGKINMFFTVGNMIMSLSLLGLDSAYIRFYNEPPKDINKNQIFTFSLLTGVVVNTIIFLIIFLINPEYISILVFGQNSYKSLLILFLYVITLIIFRQLNLTYRMEQNSKQYNVQNLAQIFINRILYVSVALYEPSYFNAILAITLGMLLLSIVYLIKRKNIFENIKIRNNKKSIIEIFKFSIPLMPTTLIIWMNDSVAKLMLGGLGRFDDIGILAMATSLANIFAIIPNGFGIYWSSFMYTNYNKENELIKKVHNYISLLSIFLISIIIIFQDVLFIILGEEYKEAQIFFTLIMLGPIQALLCETTAYGINIAKKTKYNMYITFIAFIANILSCYILIPKLGGLGAAIGIGISSLITLFLKTFIGQHYYVSINSYKKTMFSLIIITLLCSGNIFYYNFFKLKLTIVLIAVVFCLPVFKKELNELRYVIKLQFRKHTFMK